MLGLPIVQFMEPTTATLTRFPDSTYRASIGEHWTDGTYAECLAWLVAAGSEDVTLATYGAQS